MSEKSSVLDQMMKKFITKDVTFGDLMEVAIAIAREGDREMGDAFVDAYARMIHQVNDKTETHEDAVAIVRENLGYLSGYYDQETADMMYDFYGTAHPIFGREHVPSEKAIELGVAWANENL